MTLNSPISASQIKENLETRLIGSKVLVFDEVESTNELVKSNLEHDEGLVIIADSQTKGKGRSGRSWHSPKGLGIYLSVLLKPQTEHLSPLTLMAGVACVSAINEFVDHESFDPFLKWPNDILVDSRKLAGILCESCDESAAWVVIGIGINVNHLSSDFPASLSETATSLQMETGGQVDRMGLICSLITHLDRQYRNWLFEGTTGLVKRWSEYTKMFGQKVVLNCGGFLIHGTAKKLDEQGQLVVLTEDGEAMVFASGEVTLLGKSVAGNRSYQ